MITQEQLKAALDYDPETGIFTRKYRPKLSKRANAQFAGKKVGEKNSARYLYISIDYNQYRAHRLAWLFMTGVMPDSDIDHIDGNPRNNKWSNLRLATCSQNGANKKTRKDSGSGIKGAFYDKFRKCWKSAIRVNGKEMFLGRFNCPAAAHFAYLIAADINFGEFARAA